MRRYDDAIQKLQEDAIHRSELKDRMEQMQDTMIQMIQTINHNAQLQQQVPKQQQPQQEQQQQKQQPQQHEQQQQPLLQKPPGVEEPGLSAQAPHAQTKYYWRTDEVQFNDMTARQKNALTQQAASTIAGWNKVDKDQVWITLAQGSLIVQGEVEAAQGPVRWPTDEEIRAMLRRAMEGQRDAGGMAERIQAAADPWQQYRPQEEPRGRAQDDSCISHNPHSMGFRLVTEKTLNLQKLSGEQDSQNKIAYMKWSQQIKNFIESKGIEGIELVKAMDWSENQSRLMPITDADVMQRFPDVALTNAMKQLHLMMISWTDGAAARAIRYNVSNGIDAWKKLYHHQMPEIKHQMQLLSNEFQSIKQASTLTDMRERMAAIERITSLWTSLADREFDEEQKLAKLRTVIPKSVYD